jgi:flagellar hook-associated protein 3 FlgL
MLQNISSVGQQFLANLETLDQNMATTQEQLSSGFVINKPSDDPAALGDVLQLESELGNANQVSANLGIVSGAVNTAESALETATQLMSQAQSLASQGASSSASASARTSLSQQAEQILTQLVSISQTQYGSSYVFSGDQDTQPSYQLDLTSPTGVDQLITTTSTRQIQDVTGVTFGDALTAQQIFDDRNPDGSPAPDNVFAAVNSLRVALANNDQTGITNAVTSLQSASDYLSQQLSYYGGVQNQITNATDVAQKFQLQYQTGLSSIKDTNVASAAVSLSEEQASLQAATQAEASMPRTTLFDFLSSSSG